VCHPETLICIEVPYAGDMIKNCEFDTVYHEHLSYLNLRAVQALLKGTSLRLHRVVHYPIHGGAILLMLRSQHSKVRPMEGEELTDKITLGDWTRFGCKAHEQILGLKMTIARLVAEGKRVAGLGASAKSTVWINACGFTRKEISFIADTTPQKQYTLSPGSDIPICDEGAILRELPDYVIVFCWNFWGPELREKFKLARSKGVKFLVPVPTIEIYE
jgi:novobiocin biosynthesis protein NovU/D-mycarose 3-C-methyltransferase